MLLRRLRGPIEGVVEWCAVSAAVGAPKRAALGAFAAARVETTVIVWLQPPDHLDGQPVHLDA